MAICQNCGSEKIEFKREKVGTASVKTYQSGSKSNSGRVGNKKMGFGSSTRTSAGYGTSQSITEYRTVGFCKDCGNTWTVQDDTSNNSGHKNKKTMLLLCAFGGFFGLHRFYNKEIGMGILYIFTVGLFMFGWIRDLIVIAKTPEENF